MKDSYAENDSRLIQIKKKAKNKNSNNTSK